jgi:hypothetical protein
MGDGSEDVVVCGAGAAGLAAALAAARAGAAAVLVEARPCLGGTVAHSLIHTLGGLYDSEGRLLNAGLPAELVERLQRADERVAPRRMGRVWVLQACPDVYQEAVRRWVAEERITVWLGAQVRRVATANGGVTELEVIGAGRLLRLRPRAVIDATGSAEVVRLVDPALVEDDAERAAGGLIVRLDGVAPGALAFPRSIAVVRALREAVACGALPAGCAHAWVDSGCQDGEAYVKLPVPLPDDWRARQGALAAAAEHHAAAVVALLRQMPAFASARLARVGELGIRDGGRVVGEYCLTGDDVRQARKLAGAACRCAWPIEYWHPEQGVQMEYLPEGACYEIPLHALKVRGVRNLWAAGKCLSADRLAQASARVVGSCWAMGAAAGRAAATEATLHELQPR